MAGKPDDAFRLTRREQRDASRQRLLDAAFECILEYGYAATSTLMVAERAGLSSGALFNHFATKDDLIAATANDIYLRFLSEINPQLLHDAAATDEPEAAIVDFLWEAMKTPPMQAVYELFTAARTNERLRGHLASVEPAYRQALIEFTKSLLPDLADCPDLVGIMGVVLTSIQGASQSKLAFGDGFDLTETKRVLKKALKGLRAQARRVDKPVAVPNAS